MAIAGSVGNDTIDASIGDNILTEGAGDDTFVFVTEFGNDVITDFAAGAGSDDAIQFATSIFADFDAVVSSASEVSGDTVIAIDEHNSITLQNVSLVDLHDDDFSFVTL
jgi:Ca2+-binding RTX toxin-like protein